MNITPAVAWLNRSRWAHVLAAVLFAGILAVQYAPVIAGDKVFTDTAVQQGYVFPWAAAGTTAPFAVQSDQVDLSMPALAVQRRAYDAGTLPHVDLYSYGGGYPLYADLSSGQGYPPRMILTALFEPVDVHFLFTMLHLFMAGMFTYLLLRALRCRWFAAVLGGTAWMVSTWASGWMHLAAIVVITGLFPAALWAVHRAVQRRSWASVCIGGLLLGALVIAGHVLFGVVSAAVAGLWGVALALDTRTAPAERGTRLRVLAVVPTMALVAVGLWAAALVPYSIATRDSARGALTYGELVSGQLASWRDVAAVAWPYSAPVSSLQINALSFVGFLTVAFAIVGLVSRRPGAGLGRALVIGSVVTMVGGPVTWFVFHSVPLMDVFRPYTRLAFFLGFGVVLLGAIGFDRVQEMASSRWPAGDHRNERVRFALVCIAVLAMAANTLHLAHYAAANNPPLAPRSSASVLPDTAFSAALRAAAAATPDGWPGRAAIVSPMESFDSPWSPPMLYGAAGAWVGVEVSSGYNSSTPTRTQRLLRVLSGEPVDVVLRRDSTAAFVPTFWWGTTRQSLYARAGYSLVVTPPPLDAASAWARPLVASGALVPIYSAPDGNIFRIVGAVPGAHGVTRVDVVADDTAALRRFTDDSFDAASTVLLSARDAASVSGSEGALPTSTIDHATRDSNGYRFDVSATGPTLVVVPVNWGAGWSATADGHSLRIMRANYGQIVVAIPAGSSRVSLQYRTPGLSVGTLLSIATLLVVLTVPLARRIRRRSMADARVADAVPDPAAF